MGLVLSTGSGITRADARSGGWLAYGALACAILAVPSPLIVPPRAAPLPKEACETLRTERGALEGQGARSDMAKGAAWAKTNLSAERMRTIQRLIELDEQVLFRCDGARAAAAAQAEADRDDDAPKKASTPKATPNSGAAKPAASAKPATPEKRAAARKSASSDGDDETDDTRAAFQPNAATVPVVKSRSGGASGSASGAQPKADAKPVKGDDAPVKRAAVKPKGNDAYRPPDGVPQSTLKPPPVVPPVGAATPAAAPAAAKAE